MFELTIIGKRMTRKLHRFEVSCTRVEKRGIEADSDVWIPNSKEKDVLRGP